MVQERRKDSLPGEFFVPLPVQTFFWRQTGSFIRPKHGRIHESSCIFCYSLIPIHHELKEACKSIEKVLVQNIQFGLSPSLTEAIQGIPRWKLIQAAIPHIILCTAQLLNEKKEISLQNVGTAASKLLYTLHWALLDAGEECAETDKYGEMKRETLVFPVATLELFIFLFAPLRHLLRDSDLQNFRLENGLKLWPLLWKKRHPNSQCFVQPVRMQGGAQLVHKRNKKKSEKKLEDGETHLTGCKKQAQVTISKDLHDSIAEETSSVEDEHVVIFRLTSSPESELGRSSSIYKARTNMFRPRQSDPSKTLSASKLKDTSGSQPTLGCSSAAIDGNFEESPLADINLASFLDVAIIRCLFNPTWNAEGIVWGLDFLAERLKDILQERRKHVRVRKRSSSLPVPDIRISDCPNKENTQTGSDGQGTIQVPDEGSYSCNTPTNYSPSGNELAQAQTKELNKVKRRSSSSRRKATESRSNVGLLSSRPVTICATECLSLAASSEDLSTSLGRRLSKGKSMPSLSNILDELAARFMGHDESKRESGKALTNLTGNASGVQPIITVTDLSGSAYSLNQDSANKGIPIYGKNQFHRGRSMTEPNISAASVDEFFESPGVTCYITRDGGINLLVLLQGLLVISRRSDICCDKICETLLVLVEMIVDLGLLRDTVELTELAEKLPNFNNSQKPIKDDHKEKWIMTLEVILRILSNAGCPYECDETRQQNCCEHVRQHATHILTRLHKQESTTFVEAMQLLSLKRLNMNILMKSLHSFSGFCMEQACLLSPPFYKRSSRVSSDGGNPNMSSNTLIGGIRPIESIVIQAIFRTLISRFVSEQAQLKSQESSVLYEQVRQFLAYVRDTHAKVFREVALSGLIDTTKDLKRAKSTTDSQPTSVSDPLNDQVVQTPTSLDGTKRLDIESNLRLDIGEWDDSVSVGRKFSLNPTRWLKSGIEVRSRKKTVMSKRLSFFEPSSWFRRVHRSRNERSIPMYDISSSTSFANSTSAKIVRRSSTKASASLQKARQRVEMHLAKIKLNRLRKNDGTKFATPDPSRRNSIDMESLQQDAELENSLPRKIVSKELLIEGMMRLEFLLSSTAPGSIPEPHVIAAVLELPSAPVISRVCFLFECALLVRRCICGHWPSWMKSNSQFSASFRSVADPAYRASSCSGTRSRKYVSMQRAAGRMFHMWAELIAAKLEDILARDTKSLDDVVLPTNDATQRKQLFETDENEDFINEAIVNPDGKGCPWVVRLAACHLLLEITTFLRDTYRRLPRASKPSLRGLEKAFWGDRASGVAASETNSHGTVSGMHSLGTLGPNLQRDLAARRWSTALSSVGNSQNSAQSLHSIPADGPPLSALVDRKISFVLHEPDDESLTSSKSTLNALAEDTDSRRRSSSRSHLLRRGTISNSSKRRSLKLKRKEENEALLKRTDSVRSKRKVSSSEKSESEIHDISGEESPGILSDDQAPDSPSECQGSGDDDGSLSRHMPWLKVMIHIASAFNFTCQHQNFCHPRCYRRQIRACGRLLNTARQVYGEEQPSERKMCYGNCNQVKRGHTISPQQRRNSMMRHHRLESKSENSLFGKFGSKETIENDAGLMFECYCFADNKRYTEEPKKDIPPMLGYLKANIKQLFHAPLATIAKGAVLLSDDHFADIAPVAWELLLEDSQEIASTAAAVFVLAAIKVPEVALEIMTRQLTNTDPNTRINAILSFYVLWRHRFEAYPRFEDGAQVAFKVPVHSIEFTLPSPRIGTEWPIVANPPWLPETKSTVEEVTLNQDMQHRSLVTATKTRKRLELDMIENALQAEEDRKRQERETFHVSNIPASTLASFEPSLHHVTPEEHEEDAEIIDSLPLRGSVAPLQPAAPLFPSCLCAAAPYIAALVDDYSITMDNVAVYEVALKVAHVCMVEDTSLFLRHFFERLTRERNEEVFRSLRKLIRAFPEIPQQSAYVIFNAMIGFIMFHVRSSFEGSQESINQALTLIEQISRYIQGVHLKDLKQILRKEQCDMALVLFANVPAAKKIVVHGPQGPDSGGIPSQFPVQEDTQFSQILQESLDFFGIDEASQKDYHLVDLRTSKIHSDASFVRDVYSFKRSQYPQLALVPLRHEEAHNILQLESFELKLGEIGKILMMTLMLQNKQHRQQRAIFLHEELMKLPSFPRKALEVDFSLYEGGDIGKELLAMDFLHKLHWTRLVSDIFEATASTFASSGDIHIFLNVVNGALTLHAETATMLRMCLAVYINAALQFKNIFSVNGYFLIAPTLLKLYSNHSWDRLIRQAIEFTAQQLYMLHRKPFLLQLLGAAAPLLSYSASADYNQITPKDLFDLLLSLEFNTPDPLKILDLVGVDKPLKALDFCYSGEPDLTSVLECLNLCTLIVSYAPDSRRGYQLLTVMNCLIPLTLDHYQEKKDLKAEKEAIVTIAVALKTIVLNAEALSKNYTGPQRNSPVTEVKSNNSYKYSKKHSVAELGDLEAHARFLGDHARAWVTGEKDLEENENLRNQFRLPRSVLLVTIADFMPAATLRLNEIAKKTQDQKVPELLDTKSHARLADIAHTLLKEAPYDDACMSSVGLLRYMKELMPACDWSAETLRPTLMMLLRRLDKLYVKIFKKHIAGKQTDWNSVTGLLEGLYITLNRHPYIVHVQHLKSLTGTCQALIMCEATSMSASGNESSPSRLAGSPIQKHFKVTPPPGNFCSVAMRLISAQILSVSMYTDISMESQSLEQICGGSSVFPSSLKTESFLLNLLLPLCLRIGSGKKDTLRLRHADISFALTTIIHAVTPPPLRSQSLVPPTPTSKAEQSRGSVSINIHPPEATKVAIKPSIYKAAFLGFRVLLTCFEKQLALEWSRIAKCIREVGDRLDCGLHFWEFLLFLATYRPPLYLLLKPFIWSKLIEQPESDQDLSMRESIREMMENNGAWARLSKEDLLTDLNRELKAMKEEFSQRKDELDVKRGGSVLGDFQSEASNPSTLSARRSGPPGTQSRCASALGWGGFRGPSASHTSFTSGWSINLQRQWSIRSDSQAATPVLATASAEPRLTLAEKLARRTSYAGEHAISNFHAPAVSQTTIDSETSSIGDTGVPSRLQRRSQSRGRSMRGRKPSPLNPIEVSHIELDPSRDTPLMTPGSKSHLPDEVGQFQWLQVPGCTSRLESGQRNNSSEVLNWADASARRDSRQFLEPFIEYMSERSQGIRSKSPAYGVSDVIKVTPLLINVDDVIIEEQLSSPEEDSVAAQEMDFSIHRANETEGPIYETLEDGLTSLLIPSNGITSLQEVKHDQKMVDLKLRSLNSCLESQSSRHARLQDKTSPRVITYVEDNLKPSTSQQGLKHAFEELLFEHTTKFQPSFETSRSFQSESLQPLLGNLEEISGGPRVRLIPVEVEDDGSGENVRKIGSRNLLGGFRTSLDEEDTLI
ncbi:protein unc-80 homolog isoform X4 [Artemia franciscana]|uniref:protein unc-80 homolog isoform X4 n=1 Tax=Artemia franciscana TaxID=6661 RepID=UPI0032DA28A7